MTLVVLFRKEWRVLISKVKSETLVEGDPKASFSIVRCRGGRYSIPWIAQLYPWFSPYSAECLTRRHQVPFFKSLVWLWPGIEPQSPGPLANTLLIIPMARYSNKYYMLIFIEIILIENYVQYKWTPGKLLLIWKLNWKLLYSLRVIQCAIILRGDDRYTHMRVRTNPHRHSYTRMHTHRHT